MHVIIKILIIALILSGCQQRGLNVRLEGLGPSYLASTHVQTPDPGCHLCGQQLVATWYAPYCYQDNIPLVLRIAYITGAHTFHRFTMPVLTRSGTYVYRLVGEEYQKTKGILSYQVEMFEGTRLLYRWKLPTFVEWIPTEPP